MCLWTKLAVDVSNASTLVSVANGVCKRGCECKGGREGGTIAHAWRPSFFFPPKNITTESVDNGKS